MKIFLLPLVFLLGLAGLAYGAEDVTNPLLGTWNCQANSDGKTAMMDMNFSASQIILSIHSQKSPAFDYTASFSGNTASLVINGEQQSAIFTDQDTFTMTNPGNAKDTLTCKRAQ